MNNHFQRLFLFTKWSKWLFIQTTYNINPFSVTDFPNSPCNAYSDTGLVGQDKFEQLNPFEGTDTHSRFKRVVPALCQPGGMKDSFVLMFAGIKVGHWKLSNWKVVVQLLTKATLYVVDFFFPL